MHESEALLERKCRLNFLNFSQEDADRTAITRLDLERWKALSEPLDARVNRVLGAIKSP